MSSSFTQPPMAFSESAADGSSEFQFTSLDAITTVSPYSAFLSALQDDLGQDTANRVHEFVKQTDIKSLTSIAGILARIATLGSVDQDYTYVEKGARLNVAKSVSTLGSSATFPQVHAAVITQGLHTSGDLSQGWRNGGKEGITIMSKGLPVYDEAHQLTARLEDFVKNVKHSANVGGIPNPVSPQIFAWIKTNVDNMLKRPRPFPAKLIVESYKALTQDGLLTQKIETALKMSYPKEDGVFDSGSYLTTFRTRLALMKTAIATGRQTRGNDNHSSVTSPWYRYPGVPKAIARYIYINELTGGQGVARCNVEPVAQALANKEGWNIYMDPQNGRKFSQWKEEIRNRGMLTDDKMNSKCAAMFELASLTEAEIMDFVRFMNVNNFSVGWALHDGYIFVLPPGDLGRQIHRLPHYMSQCIWCNNARTLYAQSPLSDPRVYQWDIDYLKPCKLMVGAVEDFTLSVNEEDQVKKKQRREEGNGGGSSFMDTSENGSIPSPIVKTN